MPIESLKGLLAGQLLTDQLTKTLYATDASAYREMPLAVCFPANNQDIKTLITWANQNKTTLIPRTAGTSLAGQVVGKGIIVDVSRTYTNILEVNKEESWVRVQPGVVRDELNVHLKEFNLFFGPETSTANRAMIGGMVGNNSCGTNSVIYGSTRDHLLEIKGFLSDGSEVHFKELSAAEFNEKIKGPKTLEQQIYDFAHKSLSNKENQKEIEKEFPKKEITRRNTGYAIDELLNNEIFNPEAKHPFNFCRLIAGSEGTLMFITEIKLHVNEMPPANKCVVAIHHQSIDEALRANLIALKYKPHAVELIDHYILECTKANKEQMANRFFVEGDPKALLVIELAANSKDEVIEMANKMEAEMKSNGFGYHFPRLFGDDIKKVWTLRKAGLGLLSNLPGDEKAVPVIEDTAVAVEDLPAYIREFNDITQAKGMNCVHYAHAGSGELHLRPIINLKTLEGKAQFREVAEDISKLVKKYKGSLSGEHGDGRLRGEFLEKQIGKKNFELVKEFKRNWDPNNIFNANKIVDTPPMDEFLRYTPGQQIDPIKTTFRFKDQDYLQHAEQCNGSGDCRKTEISGGTMCPSYMATRNEKDTTRARANILRETLTQSKELNKFNSKEIKEVMDLCLACKGCKSECPSNVDMAKLKMEFLDQYQQANGVPLRSKMIGNFSKLSGLASIAPWAYNLVFKNAPLRKIANNLVGFHPERTMPLLSNTTLKNWFIKTYGTSAGTSNKKVFLFIDEFTNYNDVEIGKKTVDLLLKLGYQVELPNHVDSGRAYFSKGMLKEAKALANKNINLLSNLITADQPLIGIEPSAILTFRDEYPEIVDQGIAQKAEELSKNVFMVDEFLAKEIDAKRLSNDLFTEEEKLIKLHGHCQQKAVGSLVPTKKMLSLPKNYTVQLIPSGCCGMAGSFGYEKEHYDISMKIGNLVLFPTINKLEESTLIAAPGTSCRHQIHDGTGKTAFHPVELLFNALKN